MLVGPAVKGQTHSTEAELVVMSLDQKGLAYKILNLDAFVYLVNNWNWGYILGQILSPGLFQPAGAKGGTPEYVI